MRLRVWLHSFEKEKNQSEKIQISEEVVCWLRNIKQLFSKSYHKKLENIKAIIHQTIAVDDSFGESFKGWSDEILSFSTLYPPGSQ